MKPGRKPTPRMLRELHGNPRQHKMPGEPEGVGDLWDAPAWFDEEQREQWRHALDRAPPGLLTGTDRAIFTGWCVAVVEYAKAVVEVRKLGQVVKTKDGNAIQNPYLSIMNRQAMIINRLGAEMGFSPASRASLGASAPAFGDGPGSRIRGETDLDRYIAAKPDKLDS
jgi:P27 family predicted phage terminase small subunit